MSEEERALRVDYLAFNATAGAFVPATGGVRKLRWTLEGRGIRKEAAVSKVADSIRRGLEEAVAYAGSKTDERAYRVHVPAKIDVKAIRMRLDMTQDEFAGRFGFSVNTLRHWEQGSRQPEGATRAYLLVIERAPDAVRRALRAA